MYTKLSEPLKFAFGVYVNVPSAFTVTVPFADPLSSVQTPPPSPPAVSFPVRLPARTPSSLTLKLSATAVGASSTDVTFSVTVAVDRSPSLSASVYTKLSEPL